ncbi:MAG TPA: DUF222 domain-containing protein, partial [Sporichthyaceae bacterium]
MFVPPTFPVDAKALAEDITAVLLAPFPTRAQGSAVEQAQSDGLTYLGLLERASWMLAGESRRVMAVQVNLATAEPDPFLDAEHAEWSACADIALMLQVACRSADARINDARTLYERLPLTLARLRAGHLSLSKAIVLVVETANLDAPECARVEAEVLANTAGTRHNFRRRVRAAVRRVDPEAVARRREQARREREIVTFEADDGLNAVNALIPAEDAARVWQVIDDHARTLKLPGDERSIGARRADALIDLIVNRPDATPRVTYQVQVIVPVGTLLAISDDDGHIPGHGPIPAAVARELAEQAAQCRRLLVHPDTGALLDATPTGYRPRITKLTRVLKPGERATGEDTRVLKPGERATGEDTRLRIPGHGPLPTEVAELILTDPEWQRLLTDPDTGHRLDAHPDRYKPGDPLDRFIKLRDQHCRWPGCRMPAARCDVDHTIPHHQGGPTIRGNLACFCRRHHQIKQIPGWTITQGEHGELTFTTPTRRIYRTRPPNPDGTEPPTEPL